MGTVSLYRLIGHKQRGAIGLSKGVLRQARRHNGHAHNLVQGIAQTEAIVTDTGYQRRDGNTLQHLALIKSRFLNGRN